MTKPRTGKPVANPKPRRVASPASAFPPARRAPAATKSEPEQKRRPNSSENAAFSSQKSPKFAPKKPVLHGKSSVKKPLSSQKTAPLATLAGGIVTGARINRRAADRLRNGHLWVYASDIESIQLPEADAAPGLLPVADNRGLLLGTALYSPTSQIALRLISREAIDQAQWMELLAARLRAAIARRKPELNAETDSCRLCFSEADQLPGLVVDQYSNLIIVQLLAKGLDSAAVRQACVQVLREELDPAAILERPDARVRELEGLAAPSPEPLLLKDAAVSSTQFRLNGLSFQFDANSGQKTGAFLDQRSNYAAAAEWAKKLGTTGSALDVCTYQGGFALHLARICSQVTGIDSSRASLEVAEKNLEANRGQIAAQVDWVEADAFQVLRDWSDAGRSFDAIILDPPAFAKSQRAVESALRGYKELNLRALKMLRPGGLLVTCSCSHHVSWVDLEASIAAAATDAHRRVRLLERRGAALDHPVVLSLPESEYLKCLVLQVE